MLQVPSNHIRIGDLAQFPIGRLGDSDVYRHRFIVTAFATLGGNGANAVICRRLADGLERIVSFHWFEQYAIDSRRPTVPDEARRDARAQALARIRDRRIAEASSRLETDPDRPGFFVSARKGNQHRFLLGPFVDHYTALQLVETARRIAHRYSDPFCEISYGTCQTTPIGSSVGFFNAEVFGK